MSTILASKGDEVTYKTDSGRALTATVVQNTHGSLLLERNCAWITRRWTEVSF